MAKRGRPALVLWSQVWGLAAVQGSIILTWVIYNLYLVPLLTSLGFPKGLATSLLVLENLLAIAMEPLMEAFSDRLRYRVGTRFPLISLGVILAAGVFGAIPLSLLGGADPLRRWLLPLLLVTWALAMTVFRSPALSLLGRYAFRTRLPQAASILTLVGGLTGAIGPLANSLILSLGPWLAFAIGSGALLLATLALRWVGPNQAIDRPVRPMAAPQSLSWLGLALVFGTGVGVTLGFRLVSTTFPAALKQQVPSAPVGAILGLIFITLALTALPAGAIATRLGNNRVMVLGLALMALLAAGMTTMHSLVLGVMLAILTGAAFSLVANGTIPFALAQVPPEKAGLGTGLYFSGGALALSLWGTLIGSRSLPPSFNAGLAVLSFGLAGLCVWRSGRLSPTDVG